jgi:hypothetical protein
LRLDYAVLKRRCAEADVSGAPRRSTPAGFVELVPGGVGPRAECVMELEDPSGTRLRIEIKGMVPPDLTALARGLRAGGA